MTALSPLFEQKSGAARELIAFAVGKQEFCIDVMSVREIRGWTPATVLPHSQPFVRGVINLRGAVLPIMDLAVRLGFPPAEVMGRHVGHIATWAGIAGGATMTLIPEEPFDIDQVAQSIVRRHERGRYASVVVVAEGATPAPGTLVLPEPEIDQYGHQRLGGMRELGESRQAEKAASAFDRMHQPEDGVEHLGIVRVLLEADELDIELIETFVGLGKEFAQQLVHGPPWARAAARALAP